MKKALILILCLVMACSMVACGNKNSEEGKEEIKGESAQLPNPFIECDTLEEAEELAGFEISDVKNIPEEYELNQIQVIEKELMELIFENGENEIRIRKAIGNEDISGDYNEYEENEQISMDNYTITRRGDNGKGNVFTWTQGGYSYALSANIDGEGLEKNLAVDIIKDIQ